MICLLRGAMLVERSVINSASIVFTGNYKYPQNVKIEAPIVRFCCFLRFDGDLVPASVICQPGGYYW